MNVRTAGWKERRRGEGALKGRGIGGGVLRR